MGSVRIIILAVAAVAAIVLALVVRKMAAGRHPAAQAVAAAQAPAVATVQVLTAAHDLPVGIRIAQTDLAWTAWPADKVNPAYITDGAAPAPTATGAAAKLGQSAASAAKIVFAGSNAASRQAVGAIVREPILSGEPILARKIVRGGQGGYMAVSLQPGMRAVSIPMNVETGAGGFILPGDRVDVLETRKVDNPNAAGGPNAQTVVAETVLKNLRVLAIDQQLAPPKDAKAIVGTTVTLEVPAEDVEMLARAKASGDLSLSLRSYADMAGPSGRGSASAAGAPQTVTVIRAGRSTQVSAR